MRVIPWLAAALVLSIVTPAFAQEEWDNFAFTDDGFEVNFPGRPQIADTTWTSQYRYTLPARLYTASHGAERYSVTVVDYRVVEALGEERFKTCPAGAETCRGGGVNGRGYWKMDVRGAMAFAVLKFMKRDGKITDFDLEFQQVVEGYFLQLSNPDGSRTFAYITMHENRLYVFEGTTPKGAAEPALFQGSVGFVDAKGNSIRYTDYYSNALHGLRQYEPPPARLTTPEGVAIRPAGATPPAAAPAPAGAARPAGN